MSLDGELIKKLNNLQVQKCNQGRTCVIFIRRRPFSYDHVKFLDITFDKRMNFVKLLHILERYTNRFHRLKILGNEKWDPGPAPGSSSQIYKHCIRPIFKYDTVIYKIRKVKNSFIRLVLRLSKYVSACSLHENSGLP